MSLQYEFFTAEDDDAALAVLRAAAPPPVFNDEAASPYDLAVIEALLTGRTEEEVTADPRHAANLGELVDEDAGVAEYGVSTVTDTLTRALADADTAALALAASAWEGADVTVRGLASIARHAAERGHRMYVAWMV